MRDVVAPDFGIEGIRVSNKLGWRQAAQAYGLALELTLLAACSGGDHEDGEDITAKANAVVAQAAQANKQLALYQQLQRIHNLPMAASIGEDIVHRFPHSAAAAEVAQSLPALEREAQADTEQRRQVALWLYQRGPMAGGKQSTASLESMLPAAPAAVRLVLRRHSQWGTSVFLYDSGHGFVCSGLCTIKASFDGHSHPLQGFLPTTGEPALFIKNEKVFLQRLEKSGKLQLELNFHDRGRREVIFETGGFDSKHWQPVGGHA